MMSRFLVGISGMALMVCGLIKAMQLTNVIKAESIFDVVWFWIFAVPAIPFLMLLSGVILIIFGAILLSPFVGLNYLDESFEYEDSEGA